MNSFLDHEVYFNEPESDEHIVGFAGYEQDRRLNRLKHSSKIQRTGRGPRAQFYDPDAIRWREAIGGYIWSGGGQFHCNYFAFKNGVISFEAAVKATLEGKNGFTFDYVKNDYVRE